MSGSKTNKRFWNEAGVIAPSGGYGVHLDGRPLRTPAKAELSLPTRALAEAVADEWRAQGPVIDPLSMPMTRAANAAIDKVTPQRDEVAALVAAYGETDLLCYRADAPVELIARQAAAWDPLLGWAAQALDVPLNVTSGVVHVAQPQGSLARLHGLVRDFAPFDLTALHELVSLSGSLVIGLAVLRGQGAPDALWDASRVDETWQQELWGIDAEEAQHSARKKRDFLHADRFFRLANLDDQGPRAPVGGRTT